MRKGPEVLFMRQNQQDLGAAQRKGNITQKLRLAYALITLLGERFGSDSFQLCMLGNDFISMGFRFLCKMEVIIVPTYHRVVMRLNQKRMHVKHLAQSLLHRMTRLTVIPLTRIGNTGRTVNRDKRGDQLSILHFCLRSNL